MRNLILPYRATFALLFGMVCAAASAMERNRSDCPAILPADAVAISEPRLCRIDETGHDNAAVCREYSDDRQLYQLVFRGGTTPHAVSVIHANGSTPVAMAGNDTSSLAGNPQCNLERPAGVPANAAYRGTGVCEDEHGQPLPCSLFEHTSAREPEAKRYFVYYHPDGRGVRQIDIVSAGRNTYALEAELAHQLGQALSATGCCREQALQYAAYAAALFPDDMTYRAALQDTLAPATRQASLKPDCAPGSTASMSPTH